MKNKKAVVAVLVIAIVLIFGFLTKQIFTQFSSSSPFLAQLAKVLMIEDTTETSKTNELPAAIQIPPQTPPGRGGAGDGPGDSGGWTDLIPSTDSQIVYISANGTGTNCVYTMPGGSRPFGGTDPFNPTNTITPCGGTIQSNYADSNKIRSGKPDYLLLKRGDTWNVTGTSLTLNKSGRTASEKMVIGSWAQSSTPNINRPKIQLAPPSSDVRLINSEGNIHHVAITDLYLFLNTPENSPVGRFTAGLFMVTSQGPISNILVENIRVERFKDNIVIQPGGNPSVTPEYITLRRNIIADAFNLQPPASCNGGAQYYSQGIYALGRHYLVEQNTFAHNGMAATLVGYAPSSCHNHNAYFSVNTGDMRDLIAKENFFVRGMDGGKFGAIEGGEFNDNTFLKNAIAVLECCEPGQQFENNVVIEGLNYAPDRARGWGFHLGGIESVLVSKNIFAHQTLGTGDWDIPAMKLSGGANSQIIDNVVYNWCGPTSSNHDGSAISFDDNGYPSTLLVANNRFSQNCPPGFAGHVYKEETSLGARGARFQNNKYWSGTRFVSYGGGIGGGGGSFQDWVAAVSTPTNPQEVGSTFGQISFTAPDRDAATYMNSIFGTSYAFKSEAGLKAFDDKLRLQSKWNWDDRLTAGAFNDYIRCGFNMAPLHGTCSGGGGGDTQPPVVSLTAPANGATVSATVPVSATATDNVAVAKVEFYRGTTLIGTDTSASSGNVYSVNWNTTQSPNGSHIITAKAYDTATPTPNTATSQPRTVTVNNGLAAGCQRYDMDLSGALTSNDFVAYQNAYTAGDMRADMDDSGYLTANDYIAFLNGYVRCI